MNRGKERHFRRNNESGFTLAELMIALLICSLLLAGYIGANIQAQRNNEDLNERTLALQDANRAIEQIRNVSRSGNFPANVIGAYPDNSFMEGYNSLTNETVGITYADGSGNPLDVTVTVNWVSYSGRDNTERLRAYITQR